MDNILDNANVATAIAIHGPVRVREAALAAMGAQPWALRRMGIDPAEIRMRGLWRLISVCYERMSESDRGADYRRAIIDLARISGARADG